MPLVEGAFHRVVKPGCPACLPAAAHTPINSPLPVSAGPFLLLLPRALGVAMSQAPSSCPTRVLHTRNVRMQLMSQLLKALILHRSKTTPPP